MSIITKFKLIEKRKIIAADKAPVYVFEAIDTDEIDEEFLISGSPPLGKMKLRVSNPAAQKRLRESDEFMVEITPVKTKRK